MIEIARTTQRSMAAAESFFRRWCDLETHPDWAPSMEYFRLHEPFGVNARGVLKAVGGDEASFRITAVGPGFIYADTTELDGVELTVRHEAVPDADTSVVTLTAWVTGPRADHWIAEFGDGVQTDLDRDLTSLVRLLERESAADR